MLIGSLPSFAKQGNRGKARPKERGEVRVLAVIAAAPGTREACGRGLTIARQGNRAKARPKKRGELRVLAVIVAVWSNRLS